MPVLLKTIFHYLGGWIVSEAGRRVGKFVALRVLRGEAEAYVARTKQTPSEEDDARAQMILDVIALIETSGLPER